MIEEAQVGKKIKEYRIAKKVTLREPAKKTGFTKGDHFKIENTKKDLSTLPLMKAGI